MTYAIIDQNSRPYYTYMSDVFAAMDNAQRQYNWLIADWECYPKDEHIEALFRQEYLWMSGDELTELIAREDFQWIWGILCGFEKNVPLEEVLRTQLPKAQDYDGYDRSSVTLQHPLAALEIVPTDSSYVLLVSKEPNIIDCYLENCPNAERITRS
ncbi:MAG: DUF2691 family protein [Oscillospiraceae bacterium]|nr:DUF2691 family protein [Oscillospiraceae bacterium]